MNNNYTKNQWVSGETLLSAENFNRMEEGIDNAHKKSDLLNEELTNIKNNNTNIEDEITSIKESINETKESVNKVDTKINSTSNALTNLITTLGNDLENTKTKVNSIEESLASIENQNSDINTTLNNKQDNIKDLEEIRTNANLGKTASESLSNYYNKEESDSKYMTQQKVDDRVNQIISDTVDDSISNAQTVANEAKSIAEEAKNIAQGRKSSFVFATSADMYSALEDANKIYEVGDNLYIKELGVPDYWICDKHSDIGKEASIGRHGYYTIAELETQKVDLTEYPTTDDMHTAINNAITKVLNEDV